MKTVFASTLLLWCTLVFTSCNHTSRQHYVAADSTVIEHKLGKTIVYGHPNKIVAFDIGSIETLHELGIKPVAIPRNYTPDYLSDLKNDPQVEDAGGLMEPNFEKINSLAPDLIVISPRQERFYQEFVKIAPTLYVETDNTDYMQSFEDNTLLLGNLVGHEHIARERLESTRAKLQEAQQALQGNTWRALVALHNNGRFSVYGPGSRFGFIHSNLGVKPAIEKLEQATHGQKVSNEFILETNPDYLFIIDRNEAVKGKGANHDEIENKLIQQTNAYKNGHVIYLDPQVWYLSGGGITSTNKMIDEVVQAFNQ